MPRGYFRRVPLFRRKRSTPEALHAERAQLLAELEALDADAAWNAASDDRSELAEASRLKRQADALRRSISDLDRRIADAYRAEP
jgi:hypothetical protein